MSFLRQQDPGSQFGADWARAKAIIIFGLFLILSAFAAPTVFAQSDSSQGTASLLDLPAVGNDEEMLVEANELVYDNEAETVTARGNVQIYYGPYTVQADEVVYDRKSFRVSAIGNVRVTEPDGNVIYAEFADLSDDFRDGFIRSLTVETPDHTYISAATAERSEDNTTVFNRGVYTACEACEENPNKPPLWQVKAVKIVHDQKERMIYYENVSLEFMGVPIAWVPFFSNPDPTVTRKTGFLTPSIRYSDHMGFGVDIPYFINIAPNVDITLTPTPLSRQGLLLGGEFRHRTANGSYSIQAAGIRPLDPDSTPDNPGDDEDWRGYVKSQGQFAINKFWTFGWDGTLVSDRGFLDSYSITSDSRIKSDIYLTGLSDRNYFDARAMRFERLNAFGATSANTPRFDQSLLPTVLPAVDYSYVLDRDVLGGELGFTSSSYVTRRGDIDNAGLAGIIAGGRYGAGFTSDDYASAARISNELYWRRSFIDPFGQIFTPILAARADFSSSDEGFNAARTTFTLNPSTGYDDWAPATYSDETSAEFIPTVGIEYRYPWQSTGRWGTHVIEPVAQLYYRPNLHGDPNDRVNEDALSMVFDATTLFERDKFSGYDRVETGLRANVGLRYTGQFRNGASAELTLGQSYHLAGDNPFPTDSGLENTRSDYVAAGRFTFPKYVEVSGSVRLDGDDFELNRTELAASLRAGRLSATTQYARINEQDGLNITSEAEQILSSVRLKINDEWSIAGAVRYDLAESEFDRRTVSLHYGDECFTFSVGYTESFDSSGEVNRSVGITFNLRTLGGLNASTATADLFEDAL